MDTYIRRATGRDIDTVLALYRSLIGTPGCAWNDAYPGREDVERDVQSDALFLICGAQDEVLGALAACEDDIGSLPAWSAQIKRPCLLARLGVLAAAQGRGLARALMLYAEADAKARGCDGVHFLVSQENPRALRLYDTLGYRNKGGTRLFDIDWYCYEKAITQE